jgi:hypothetical protein
MSAVKMVTPDALASAAASGDTLTSNARMSARSGALSTMTPALITSRLCTGPMLMDATGIEELRRKSSSASSAPSVEACGEEHSTTTTSQMTTDRNVETRHNHVISQLVLVNRPGKQNLHVHPARLSRDARHHVV